MKKPIITGESDSFNVDSRDAAPPPDGMSVGTLAVVKPLSKLTELEFYKWLIAFAPVFAQLFEALGFAKSVSDAVNNDAAWADFFLKRDQNYSEALKLNKRVRTVFYEGNQPNQNTPQIPKDVPEPEQPTEPMQPNVYKRNLALVTQIRKSQGFNNVVAALLGLDWKPGNGQSSGLKLEVFQTAKGVECRWTKDGKNNVAGYFEYDPTGKGDEENFVHLMTVTKSPAHITPDLPEGVSAAVWAIRYCLVIDNVVTKVWSNTVQVTVSKVVNPPKGK